MERGYLHKSSITVFILLLSIAIDTHPNSRPVMAASGGYDLIFVVDSSFGMTKYFDPTMQVLQRFIKHVKETGDHTKTPVSAGVLLYRDRYASKDCDVQYLFQWEQHLTDDINKVADSLSNAKTAKCDDMDEHGPVFDALFRAIVDMNTQWHDNHSKFIFLIGNVPPHPHSDIDKNPWKYRVPDITSEAAKKNIRFLTFKIGQGNCKEFKELGQDGRFRMIPVQRFEQELENAVNSEWQKALENKWSKNDSDAPCTEDEVEKAQRQIDTLVPQQATEQITDRQKQIASSIGISVSDDEVDLSPMFKAVRGVKEAKQFDLRDFSRKTALNTEHAMWPVYQFLNGECLRLQGKTEDAFEAYRQLATWAATDPYKDGRGACALASLSLWRWLEMLERKGSFESNEVNEFLNTMDGISKKEMIRRVFKADGSSLFISLPQIEEDLYRRSSHLAWNVGMKNVAGKFFLSYINISQKDDFSDTEKLILTNVLDSGVTTKQEIAFQRAKRLVALGKKESAINILDELQSDSSVKIRTKAQFELSKIERTKHKTEKRESVVTLLDKVIRETPDTDLKQEALYLRMQTLFREGPARDLTRAMEDMTTLISHYPEGRFTDDALYLMARHYQQTEEHEKALDYYRKLRSFKGPNDWFNLAFFQPAMILYSQGSSRNSDQIEKLLNDLLSKRPDGPLRLSAKFWIGRIYEDTGRVKKAEKIFEEIIAEAPYDYYALRVRMHLNKGSDASGLIWPDSKTKEYLRAEYRKSAVDTSMKRTSKYYQRLRNALSTGLYSEALSSENMLRKIFSSLRAQNIPLSELDSSGILPYLGLLLSFREDARAASSSDKDHTSNLQIAGAVGVVTRDWPLAITMAGFDAKDQKDERFPATAFPVIYPEFFKKAGAKNGVKPEILYSIVREESNFFPSALSTEGAIGIFQFLPSTLNSLIKKHKQFDLKDQAAKDAFLLNPISSIELGGVWFGNELMKRQKGNIFYSILEHNAGYPAVSLWVKNWESLGREKDVEYMAETVRYIETRFFARKVLRNLIIVDSSGMFSNP